MAPHSELDATDAAHLAAFETGAIPVKAWGHRAHLHAAFGLLRRYTFDEALLRMRAGIFALNAVHGVASTVERGYHETLTVAWMAIMASASAESGAPTFDALLEARPHLLTHAPIERSYSPERWRSLEARARFVPPDRAPLPHPSGGRA